MKFESNYSLTKSTRQINTNNLDISVGQQLRYVPLHKGVAAINFLEQDFSFSLRTSYTGEVITSYALPNNKKLDAFVLTDFSIKYKKVHAYIHSSKS